MNPPPQKFWVVAALSVLPIPIFAGYRYWMRKRSNHYWRSADPAKMYYMLTHSEPPHGRIFVTEEVEDMVAQMAAQEAPFWSVNYITPLSHETYVANLDVEIDMEMP